MSDSHQIPITDEMIALAWNAMRPSHRLRGIEAHEAAEMKAAISAALGAVPAVAVPMAEAWELSAADTEQRAEGAGQDYNQGVAEGLRICAKDLRAALDATPAAVQTHAEAAAALGINSALTRIRAGNHAEAIEPLEHALRALAAAPSAELIAATITHHFRYTGGSMGSNDELRVQEAVKYALSATKAADELDESREDLFWKLHSLSKSLESRGLIDQHDQPEAYAAILDAMKLVRQGAAAAPVVLPEPVAFALEWTFDGEERGIRLYDDERHCRLDAESDGGVCSPLYTEQQVRALLAQAAIAAAPAHHAEGAQTDLHAAIMNIPVNKAKLEHLGINERLQYKIGHRDARHDAAELAVAHAPPQAQADAREAESDYQRGYRHGYNRRDAEVQGALL